MAIEIVIGCVLIVICALAGRSVALKKTIQADLVRKLQEDLRLLRHQTIEKRLSADEALSKLKGETFLKMREKMQENGSFTLSGAWEQSCGREEEQSEVNDTMISLFTALESLGREEQETEYERTLNDLKTLEEKRRREGMEKLRLYTSLGALTGLCAVIFLI